jgi:hypothetical protein
MNKIRIILNFLLSIVLGAIGGQLLGFLFFLVPEFLGSTGSSDDHFGNWEPGASWGLGGMYGVPLGLIFSPLFYITLLRNKITFRMVWVAFLYTFFCGLPGFLILFPLGIVMAVLGFGWACVRFKQEELKANNA